MNDNLPSTNDNQYQITINGISYASIWDAPKFPSKTKPATFSPAKLRDALDYWSKHQGNIHVICTNHGCEYNTVQKYIDEYPEIATYYAQAQKRRVEYLVDSAEDLINAVDPVLESRPGVFQSHNAAVRKAEAIVNHRHWYAEKVHKKYAAKQEISTTNTNVNLNAQIKVDDNATLSSIIQAMRGRKD